MYTVGGDGEGCDHKISSLSLIRFCSLRVVVGVNHVNVEDG